MKTARILTMLVILLALSQDMCVWGEEPQAPSEEPQRPAVVAFVNVNVVPMDRERILPGQTVIVRADRISEIGPADTTDIPKGALRIDGRDKYLMPGLVDMHVHLMRPDQDHRLILFIVNGVTAIRDMWGTEYYLRLREQIKKGKPIGPTIYTTGPIIDGSPPIWPTSIGVETPKQAAQVVAEHKEAGYDFIKVYSRLSVECYDTIIEAAAKHGMPVVGHVPGAVGLEHALDAGQHSIEHLSGYGPFLQDETKMTLIAQTTREAGTWNCVTLVLFQKRFGMSSEEAEQERKLAYMKYVSSFLKMRWQGLRSKEPNHSLRMSNRKRITKALHDGGARIVLGTDTPSPYVMAGFSIHQELRNLVEVDLTPYEAIKAGTRDAAECLGELDEFGTISEGLRADLILVEDNPLEDVGNAARRIGVMARGRWFPQSELRAMLDALAIKLAITTVSLRQGGPVGKMTYDDANDMYTIHGAGNNIWYASDQFHFTHNKLNGDGSITARIDSVQRIHDWTKAGVMIRDTTASDSAFAAVFITAKNRVCLQYRSEAGEYADGIWTDQDALTLPHWIKLIRQGKTFKAKHSEDGKRWKDVKDSSTGIEIEMDEPMHIGLAVCSRSGPTIAAEAKISQVSFGGGWSSSGQFTRSEDIGYEAWGKPEEKAIIPPDK
jgi:imidazolonepropionase-like amidohydrolase